MLKPGRLTRRECDGVSTSLSEFRSLKIESDMRRHLSGKACEVSLSMTILRYTDS